ncbi:hypothetical protein [Neptuniibacter halophilus]|uniref:hypothetical protein n=1 Tax=Neptuniibacter halophilus TaxID=651666 RepID=UPI00257319C5|nr:hypothetical protein [Neptuniibacter halophilus]
MFSALKPLILILSFFCTPVWAQLSPPQLQNNWPKVGEARLTVLWFDIYQAVLFTPSGQFESYRAPLKLQLTYQRSISREDLISETGRLLVPFAAPEQRTIWLQALREIWPGVNDKDQLVFQVDDRGSAHFFYNRVWIGSVEDPAFSAAFIQIWLSEQSEYPALARQLRGVPRESE